MFTASPPAARFSLCVYCGSRDGSKPAYIETATQVGRAITKEGMRLVYGAGDVGLMGAVARATQAEGGETFGVIPVHLLDMEVGKRDLTTFVVTENHARAQESHVHELRCDCGFARRHGITRRIFRSVDMETDRPA